MEGSESKDGGIGENSRTVHKIANKRGFPAPVEREGRSRLRDRLEVVARAKVCRAEKPWR